MTERVLRRYWEAERDILEEDYLSAADTLEHVIQELGVLDHGEYATVWLRLVYCYVLADECDRARQLIDDSRARMADADGRYLDLARAIVTAAELPDALVLRSANERFSQ